MGQYQLPHFVVNYDAMTSDFLIARPRRLYGLARLLDLFGLFDLYNQSSNPPEADARATFSDWAMVGRDIRDAVESFEATCEK